MVSIKGLTQAAVLAALWNNSRSPGIAAFMQNRQTEMTEADAAKLLETQSYFDYLNGRVLKVRLNKGATEFEPALYDRDNGKGAAQSVVDTLRG